MGLPFDIPVVTAVIGGANGAIGGAAGIYDWSSWRGPVALVADSMWGLPFVAASLLIHLANAFWPGADYRPDISRRAGYHVYGGGARVRPGYVWTIGNVVSNARPTDDRRRLMIDRHEGLHVLQHRLLGPLYPVAYVLWLAVGAVAGTLVWAVRRGSWWKTGDTIAYYDNPFETWAYRRDERWPHPGADIKLVWGARRYSNSKE